MNLNFQLLKHQKSFLKSQKKHTVLVAGFGSGKTQAGVAKIIYKLVTTSRKLNVAYYLPNYNLITDIAVPRISEFLEDAGIPFKYNTSDKIFSTKFGKILLRNMTKPETIVGYEVFYSLIDEIDTLPKSKASAVFKKIIGRNRQVDPKGTPACIDLVSTPEGFNFLYEFSVKNANDTKELIKAKTFDNPFLPSDYIDTLTAEYTIEELTAYINGEFCNLTSGSVYKSYNRDAHNTDVVPRENEKLYIGMDFNVQDMSAVVHVMRNEILYAVDEFCRVYNTEEMAALIRERYPKNEIEINPDASSRNRRSAGLSDYDVLQEDQYNFLVNIKRKNPEILNRVRGVNKGFESGKYFVNSKQCPTFTSSLEQQSYKNGLPDKTSGIDGVLDAGGYCVVTQLYG